ncbi:MAG: hypothetical protein K2H70_02970, partial [Bacteroidales bacterium]|nr:hypothetical protein [Bacteroidales bacterium]
MRQRIRKVILWILGLGSIVFLLWAVRFAENRRQATPCSGYDIRINRQGNVYLQNLDVERWLDKSVRWKEGTRRELNPSLIEHTLWE